MNDVYQAENFPGVLESGCKEKKEKAQTPAKLLISAAVFGALFSYLFANQLAGLNVLIFVLLLYAFALFNKELFMKRTFREEKLITLLTLPAIFLAVCMFTGSTFLNGLSILVILFVMFVQYMVLSDNALYRWYKPMFVTDIIIGGLNRLFLGLGHFSAGSVNSIFNQQSEKKKGAVIGLLIGAVLLILIVPLLLMADPALSAAVSILLADINIGDILLYIFLFFVGASAAAAPIATAKRSEYTGNRTARDYSHLRPVQGVTVGVALSMVSLVYILYGAVQFGYFFQPRETMADILGLTSSAYAVRGFGELLFITCLNFVIVGLSLRFTKQKEGRAQPYLKALCAVLIAFNFVIMASSHMRLAYYELSFGYTVARFISHSFMLLLVILNVIMLARVFIDKTKAIKLFAVAALVYFCGLVAVNPEAYVARSNIQRYEQTGKIDAEYMLSLSGGAVLEACDFFEDNPELFDARARSAAAQKYVYYIPVHRYDWQSINLADRNAYLRLKELLNDNYSK